MHTVNRFSKYHKFQSRNLPEYFLTHNFFTNRMCNNYNIRYNYKLSIHFVKHAFAQKCLRYSIPKLINDCPSLIKDKVFTHSLQGFSLYVKKYICEKYAETCFIPDCYVCMPP